MIAIKDLHWSIGQNPILRAISTQIPAGKITALIGPNGAGKSSLLHLIGRLVPLQSGCITIDGRDLARSATQDLARDLAILGQKTGVASRLKVRELVGFGRWPHRAARNPEADRQAIDRALADMGLDSLQDRFLDALSGGQQQRAFLAMALAQETRWLLLDEPLNNLDMGHARALMARLAALRDAGRGIVVVMHDVNYAAAWADHVIALREGQLLAEGPPAQVLTPENLARLYDVDLRVEEIGGRPMVLHHL